MADYRPPLRDIRFNLEHIVDIGGLASFPDFEHAEPDMVFGALDEAGRFISDLVAPTNVVGDRVGARFEGGEVVTPDEFKDVYRRWVAAGWGSIPAPTEFGGHGFPTAVGVAVQEMLTTANMALSLCPMLTRSAIELLVHHGAPDQQERWLGKLITGEWTGTMVLTEPEAGSDVGALRTRAEPVDDGTWRITGTKIYITWGEHDMTDNIVHLVLARTPGAPPGTKGISLFIVPKFLVEAGGAVGKRNSVTCISIEEKLGIHGSPTCVMAFEDAIGYLVGEVNQGMRYMFTMMNDARLNVGLEGLAVSVRAFQQALDYAQQRRQGRAVGAPKTESSLIIEHPDVRRMLMTMKANIEAMRSLLYDNAAAIDRSRHAVDPGTRLRNEERAALLTPISKGWCTDLGVEMTSLGVQIHGGMGYVEETGAAQHYRDARIAPIYEGTNGIQAIDLVMRKLPMEGGAVVRGFIDEIEAVAVELSVAGLDDIRDHLLSAVAVLRNATEWLLSTTDTNDALAGASPYLRMFGNVAGGYYMARGALAAHRALNSGPSDFQDAKIATARFYATNLLPQAAGLLPAVTAGSGFLLALDPKQLEG